VPDWTGFGTVLELVEEAEAESEAEIAVEDAEVAGIVALLADSD
jgi:hypothetical protein